MMDKELRKKFLTKTDDTGRFIVTSKRTGITYAVEPTGFVKTAWGDVNPATGKTEGKYGSKYRGSIDEKDSLITEENGFENIKMLDPGMSPLAYIDMIDDEKPDKE